MCYPYTCIMFNSDYPYGRYLVNYQIKNDNYVITQFRVEFVGKISIFLPLILSF